MISSVVQEGENFIVYDGKGKFIFSHYGEVLSYTTQTITFYSGCGNGYIMDENKKLLKELNMRDLELKKKREKEQQEKYDSDSYSSYSSDSRSYDFDDPNEEDEDNEDSSYEECRVSPTYISSEIDTSESESEDKQKDFFINVFIFVVTAIILYFIL